MQSENKNKALLSGKILLLAARMTPSVSATACTTTTTTTTTPEGV